MGICASSPQLTATSTTHAWPQAWNDTSPPLSPALIAALSIPSSGCGVDRNWRSRGAAALARRRRVVFDDGWLDRYPLYAGLALASEAAAAAADPLESIAPAVAGTDAATIAAALTTCALVAATARVASAAKRSDREWDALQRRPHANALLWRRDGEAAIAARALHSLVALRLPNLAATLRRVGAHASSVSAVWTRSCFLDVAPLASVAALVGAALVAPQGVRLFVRVALALFVVAEPRLAACATVDELRAVAAALRLDPGSADASRFNAALSNDATERSVARWSEAWHRSALDCILQPERLARVRRPRVEGDDDATAAATTWLGFDLDHTLAQYNVAPCTAMLLETAATVLAQQGKLPNAASLAVRTPPRGLQLRGAVGDKELGNVLWLDGDARVARGWHGSRELSAAVLAATYGAAPLALNNPTDKKRRYAVAHVQTGLPLLALFALAVDERDTDVGGGSAAAAPTLSYCAIYNHVSSAFRRIFSSKTPAKDNAETIMREDLPKYIDRSEAVAPWLRSLRSAGVKTFLVTNADWDHTEALCKRALGEQWRDLFEIVVVESAKPGFFTATKRFRVLNSAVKGGNRPTLKSGGAYRGGNATELAAFFAREEGGGGGAAASSATQQSIWYCGDHLEQDVASAAAFGWRSVAIVPEIGAVATHANGGGGARRRKGGATTTQFRTADALAYIDPGNAAVVAGEDGDDASSRRGLARASASSASYAFPSAPPPPTVSSAATKSAPLQLAMTNGGGVQSSAPPPRPALSLAAATLMAHASLCVPSVRFLAEEAGVQGTLALLRSCDQSSPAASSSVAAVAVVESEIPSRWRAAVRGRSDPAVSAALELQ